MESVILSLSQSEYAIKYMQSKPVYRKQNHECPGHIFGCRVYTRKFGLHAFKCWLRQSNQVSSGRSGSGSGRSRRVLFMLFEGIDDSQ